MATVNADVFHKKLSESKSLENLAYGAALRKFNSAKPQLIGDFQNHPVTVELENGPTSENVSGTLSEGNLFSFIGFNAGENPLEKLYDLIFKVKLKRFPEKKVLNGGIKYSFQVELPKDEDIKRATPMPDWSNGSWATKIEKGISGLEYYLYGFGSKFRNSRSGTGLQIKNKLRSGQFKGIKYLSEIFDSFAKKLKE